MPKIALYSIAKNESDFVSRWYNSAKEADAIFVADTGSEDNTLQLLQHAQLEGCPAVQTFEAYLEPFRFDVARNFILNQIPEDEYEWAIFLDMDEVLETGWCQKLKQAIKENPDATAINTRMVYEVNDKGYPTITYNRLMAHRTAHYYWLYPIHEVLAPVSPHEVELYSGITVQHLPDRDKDRSQYLGLLEMSVFESPNAARPKQYLGREYAALGKYAQAITVLKEHYRIETNAWLRSESCRLIADCFEAQEDTLEARDFHTLSCAEAPDIRESWAEAAAFYFRVGRLHACLGYIENMFDVTEKPEHTIIRRETYYREWPYHMAAVCYQNLGNNKLARLNIQKAAEICPEDRTILSDLVTICDIPISNK